MQVTNPAPHTMKKLLAVSQDMAEILAVVTPHETSLRFVHLYSDCNMAKVCQFEYLLGF
jgi:hypothetical protein